MQKDLGIKPRIANAVLLFLILFMLGLGGYIYYNVEHVKTLQNPGDYCEELGYMKLLQYDGL